MVNYPTHPDQKLEEMAGLIAKQLLEGDGHAPFDDHKAQLIEALSGAFGSPEQFYQEYYTHLTPEQRRWLGLLVDQKVQGKLSFRISALLQSKTLRQIIETLRMAGVKGVSSADIRLGFSPVQSNSSLHTTYKRPSDRNR